jgi:hypothetical protein
MIPSRDSSGGPSPGRGFALVGYTLYHLPAIVPIATLADYENPFWARVRARLMRTRVGQDLYRRYEATSGRLILKLNALPPAERGLFVRAMAMTLFAPFKTLPGGASDAHAMRAITDTVQGLAYVFNEPMAT